MMPARGPESSCYMLTLMRDTGLALASYKHFHVYYLIIAHDNAVNGRCAGQETEAQMLSGEHRIIQPQRTRSQPSTSAGGQGLRPSVRMDALEGEVSGVLGVGKRAFSRSREARGPHPGKSKGQREGATCLEWGLLCT